LRLIVGCPIAHRAWALPRWMECLARQTRRPDGLAFVHSGQVDDETWVSAHVEAARHDFLPVAIQHAPQPTHQRHDNDRFATLAELRNKLLTLARDHLHADLFLSLDSDVMLENPRTIEHLELLVTEQGFDIASPATFMHPLASNADIEQPPYCWAFNAGWWKPGGVLNDPERPWLRPSPDTIAWGEKIETQVPMAAWLGNRRAMDCRYRFHESGEDLGFAHDIDAEGLRVIWDTSLRARHIWCEQDLHVEAAA
jgi:hypothetical protein